MVITARARELGPTCGPSTKQTAATVWPVACAQASCRARLETPQRFLQCMHVVGAGLGQVHSAQSADVTCKVARVPGTLGGLGELSNTVSLPRTS